MDNDSISARLLRVQFVEAQNVSAFFSVYDYIIFNGNNSRIIDGKVVQSERTTLPAARGRRAVAGGTTHVNKRPHRTRTADWTEQWSVGGGGDISRCLMLHWSARVFLPGCCDVYERK